MPKSMGRNSEPPRESFEERIDTLFEELELAVKWQRPSILLAIYSSEPVRRRAEKFLRRKLAALGQNTVEIKIDKTRFDIPLLLAERDDKRESVFFVRGLRLGGGKSDKNAYKALNIRREYFVDHHLRAVFWLTEAEAFNLPHLAPDFWVFRHRVVELINLPLGQMQLSPRMRRQLRWEVKAAPKDLAAQIAIREMFIGDLPDERAAQSTRAEQTYVLATLYWSRGEPQKARALLKECLRLTRRAPGDIEPAQIWTGLGITAHELGNWREAAAAFEKALALTPGDAQVWGRLGGVQRAAGRARESLAAYKKANQLDAHNASAWAGLGDNYADRRRVAEAGDCYRRSLSLDAKNAAAWEGLGDVYRAEGDLRAAIRAYEAAGRLNSKPWGIWYKLALAYDANGARDAALRAGRKALRRAPKNQLVIDALAELRRG